MRPEIDSFLVRVQYMAQEALEIAWELGLKIVTHKPAKDATERRVWLIGLLEDRKDKASNSYKPAATAVKPRPAIITIGNRKSSWSADCGSSRAG